MSSVNAAENDNHASEELKKLSPNKQRSFVTKLGHKMGDLPELKWRGHLLSGKALNLGIAVIANIGFASFGYDQGVFSGLLTLDVFQTAYPKMTPVSGANAICWIGPPEDNIRDLSQCTGDATLQAWGVASYQVGCFLGSLLVLKWGEQWGRRSSTFWGSVIMVIGTVMQVAGDLAPDPYGLLIAGRIIGGIGNGMVTSTIPTWQSECARPEKRGRYITISGAMISAGIAIAYWINYGFYFLQGSVRWRFPLMFQSFLTLIVMFGLFFLPDSPRWLLSRGHADKARDVQARLLGLPENHPDVIQEMHEIEEMLNAEGVDGNFKMGELLVGGAKQNLRRLLIACAAQFFQQICGINLITYYATFVFENSLGFDAEMSRLLAAANGSEYFLASLVAIPLIDRIGRRKLMLLGAAGMCWSMAMLAGSTSTGATLPNGAPQLTIAWGIVATVFLFVFNTFFAIGWLGMTWLYPAEISNTRTRIQVNALSTSTNWIGNFLIVMITPPAFANLGFQTYIIFAVFCAAIFPSVWFFFPETKNRKLEEMDVIFAAAHSEGISPVAKAASMPRLEAAQLQEAVDKYFGPEDLEKGSLRQRSIFSRSRSNQQNTPQFASGDS